MGFKYLIYFDCQSIYLSDPDWYLEYSVATNNDSCRVWCVVLKTFLWSEERCWRALQCWVATRQAKALGAWRRDEQRASQSSLYQCTIEATQQLGTGYMLLDGYWLELSIKEGTQLCPKFQFTHPSYKRCSLDTQSLKPKIYYFCG